MDNLKALLRRQTHGGQPQPLKLSQNSILSHAAAGIVELLHRRQGIRRVGNARFIHLEVGVHKLVRVAQVQDAFAHSMITAVVEIDAQHPDQFSVMLDEQRGGTQRPPFGGHTAVMRNIVLFFIAFVHQNFKGHIGQRRADLPAAHMTVCDGNNGTVFVCQVMQSNLIIRSQGMSQKFCQPYIMPKHRIRHIVTFRPVNVLA